MQLLVILERSHGGELRATQQLLEAGANEGLAGKIVWLDPLVNTALIPFSYWILKSLYLSARLSWGNRQLPIVYTTTYLGALGALAIRGLTKQRIVLHYHGSRLPDSPRQNSPFLRRSTQRVKRFLSLHLHKLCLERVNLLCVPSETAKQSLLRDFPGIQVKQITLIPNGVNTTIFHPLTEAERSDLRKPFHIPKASFVCLIISRLNQEKRVIETINFIEAIQAFSRRQVLIVLAYPAAGNDGKYLAAVQKRLSHFEVPHIALEEYPKIEHLYQMSDCVISHSEREVFSLALLEAASCGIPYFATPNGSTEKYLEHIDPDLILPSSNQKAARQVLAGTHRRKLLEKLRAFAASHSWQASAVLLQRSLLELR